MGGTGTGTGDITFMGAILPGDGRQPVYCFQLRAVEHTQKNWITAQKKLLAQMKSGRRSGRAGGGQARTSRRVSTDPQGGKFGGNLEAGGGLSLPPLYLRRPGPGE